MSILNEYSKRKKVGAVKLGFIGLGYTGSQIAKWLIDAGHRVVVYNRDSLKAETLASQGAETALWLRFPQLSRRHMTAHPALTGREL